MAMYVNRFKRHRKNVVVAVRNKNNKKTTNFQTIRSSNVSSRSRKSYIAPRVTNIIDTSIVRS